LTSAHRLPEHELCPSQVTGTITGVPATATAVVVNATAAHGSAASFLTVYPAGVTTVPTASNLNFSAGEALPTA
jgi:hypothetical protein